MGASGKKKIGVDFDNTIINYDAVFLAAAKRLGLVAPGFGGGKEQVRDVIRELPDGEHAWQRLQGHVYGTAIMDAVMFDGVEAFLRGCRAKGYPVSIVSHKTAYGHFDETRVNLRQAALDWMTAHGFFQAAGVGLPADAVAFEATRADKLARIAALGCTHFIDDLPEVLDDPAFPPGVEKFLFTNGARRLATRPDAYAHWRDIAAVVLA